MPRRDKTFKSHKDRRLQTLDRKRAKNYMANLLQKYKPLVPEHVDFVKGPEPEKRAFKLVANDVEAIAKDPKNGGDIAKIQSQCHDKVELVAVTDSKANVHQPEDPVVIPETQMESDEDEDEMPQSVVFGSRTRDKPRTTARGLGATFHEGLFQPDRPSSSSEEECETKMVDGYHSDDDDKENVPPNGHVPSRMNRPPAFGERVTTIPETPFLETNVVHDGSNQSQSLEALSPTKSKWPLVDDPVVVTGVVVGSPNASACQDNNDSSDDDNSSVGSVPDPEMYQNLPDHVQDDAVIRERPANNDEVQHGGGGGPPGDEPNGDPDSDPEDDGPYGDPEAPFFNPNGHHNVNNPIVQDRLIQCFAQKFAARRAELLAGHFVAEGFYAFIVENRQLIYNILRYPKVYKTMRRRADKKLPPISMHFLIRNRQTNEEFWTAGETFNAKDYGNPLEYHVVETWTRISLIDAIEMTDEWHHRDYDDDEEPPWRDMNGDPTWIDLSWDGVALDKKNDQVLEVLSMRLTDCNRILPLAIYIGDEGCKMTEQLLRPVLDELATVNVKVRYFLADSKARVVLLAMVAVTGYHGCQFCMARGVTNEVPMVNEQGAYNRRGGAVLWTDETFDQEPRTHAMFMQQAQEANDSHQTVFGVKGLSCVTELFDDVMEGIPIDSFHCAFLGLSKKIMNELLGISNVYRARPENRQARQDINARYPFVRVPSEVQRSPRKIDEKSFKAQEWKVLTMVGFPIVVSALNNVGLRQEARAFTLYVYLLRAMYLDDAEFEEVKAEVDLKLVMRRFYRSYVNAFGAAACTPTVHLFSHLLEQRNRDYLSATSTEVFESFYAILKNTYRKGTPSIGKQMFGNILSHYFGQETHNCRKSFRYRPKGRDMKDDSLIWSANGYLKIEENLPDRMIRCRKILVDRYTPDVIRNLPFDKVGVAKWRQLAAQEVVLSADDIKAKVVKVEQVLVTLPFDCLYS